MNESQKMQSNNMFIEYMKSKQTPFLSSIQDYCELIAENIDTNFVTMYIFNIFRDIGYILMTGTSLDKSFLNTIVETINLNIKDDGKGCPFSINLEKIDQRLDDYIEEYNDFCDTNQPKFNSPKDQIEIWEETWFDLKKDALSLINYGMDIIAVEHGYEWICNNQQKKYFEKSWKRFNEQTMIFLLKLYSKKELFYLFSDGVQKLIADYHFMKNKTFYSFVSEIESCRKTYAEENYYRRLISPEDASEAYQNMEVKIENLPPAARIYFYKRALGELSIKSFVLNIYYAQKAEQEPVIYGKVENNSYVLYAGDRYFSIHMIDDPEIGGWGLSKDYILNQLKSDSYEGAIFCSMREFSSENILVCLENFIKKDRMKSLIDAQKELFKNYIRLEFDDVYHEDLRSNFIKMAVQFALPLPLPLPLSLNIILYMALIQTHNEKRCKQVYFLSKLAELGALLKLISTRKVSKPQSGGKSLPDKHIIHVLENLKQFWNNEYDCMKPSTKNNDIEKIKSNLNKKWSYFSFSFDFDGKIISNSELSGDIKKKSIKIKVKEHTAIIMFAIGPKKEINYIEEIYKTEKEFNEKSMPQNVFWIVYEQSEIEDDNE